MFFPNYMVQYMQKHVTVLVLNFCDIISDILLLHDVISKRDVRGGASAKWGGGTKRKNWNLWLQFPQPVAYEMQHNFFYPESLVHSRYNCKKIRSFGWFRKNLYFVGRCREKNLQCRM